MGGKITTAFRRSRATDVCPETSQKGNLLFSLFSCDHTIPTGIVYFSAPGFNSFISHCVPGFHTEQFPLAKTEGTIFPFQLQLNKRIG